MDIDDILDVGVEIMDTLPLQAFDGIGGTEDGRLRDFFHQRSLDRKSVV